MRLADLLEGPPERPGFRPEPMSLRVLVFALGLGAIVTWASWMLRFDHRADVLHNLSAVLHRQPMDFGGSHVTDLPVYNRVLVPGLHWALSTLIPAISPNRWYLLLRVGTFELSFVAFAFTCCRALGARPRDACFALALLALSLMTTFVFAWEDPSESLTPLVFSIAVLLALERRFVAILVLTVIFAANHDSASYCGIVWFFLAPGRSSPWRRVLQSVAICVVGYAAVIAFRDYSANGVHAVQWLTLGSNGFTLLRAVREYTPVNWLTLLVAIGAVLWANADLRQPVAARLAVLAVVFVVPAVVFGMINELRVFAPCFVMLSLAAACTGPRTPAATL